MPLPLEVLSYYEEIGLGSIESFQRNPGMLSVSNALEDFNCLITVRSLSVKGLVLMLSCSNTWMLGSV